VEDYTRNRRGLLIALIAVAIAALLYLIAILIALPIFQNSRLTDPLAEIHSLFPLYYIAIGIMAVVCFGCVVYALGNSRLHISLLGLFGLMLWFTPYYLAGFTMVRDGPWRIGVSMRISEVLAGNVDAFSVGTASYPISFIYHYSFVNITGVEPLTYTGIIFPLISILLFILLGYTLISRILGDRVAFLAMLLGIPGLHYVLFHPSPRTVGLLLMMTTLLLLTRPGVAPKVMAVVIFPAILLSHAISPIILVIFIVAAVFANYFFGGSKRQLVVTGAILAVGFAGWLLLNFEDISGSLLGLFSGDLWERARFWPENLFAPQFIYSGIYYLNIGVYGLFAAGAIATVGYVAARAYAEERSIKNWLRRVFRLNRGEAIMVFSVILLSVATLMLASRSTTFIERGLTFIILALSCLIASVILRSTGLKIGKRIGLSVLILLLVLTLSFPVVAYSIHAYDSFPPSEQAGLEFTAEHIPLEGKAVATTNLPQLTLFTDPPPEKLRFIQYILFPDPTVLIEKQPDIIIFRSTAYFNAAMRWDLSFEENRFITYRAMVDDDSQYHRVYSSPTFEIYTVRPSQ